MKAEHHRGRAWSTTHSTDALWRMAPVDSLLQPRHRARRTWANLAHVDVEAAHQLLLRLGSFMRSIAMTSMVNARSQRLQPGPMSHLHLENPRGSEAGAYRTTGPIVCPVLGSWIGRQKVGET